MLLSIGERLSYFIDKHLLISVREFEKNIKAPQGAIQRAINGSNIGVDKLQKIVARYNDLNAHWLLTGEGVMLEDIEESTSMSAEPTPQLTRSSTKKSIQELSSAVYNLSEDAVIRSEAEKIRSEADLIRAQNERMLVSLLEVAVK